ncbi:MAG: hypothetical protein N2606_07245 [Candidatus Omnitrophica bacterium]|nr:hypothetical protein [Candidatus Omnitrophota bacterium]
MRRSLKRFERLENKSCPPKDFSCLEKSVLNRRFERLEVNEHIVEFCLLDKVCPLEKSGQQEQRFISCPFCGEKNSQNALTCQNCHRKIYSEYIADYTGQEDLLKRCICGAINLKERRNCWVCGRDFNLYGASEVKPAEENIITLKIDGVIYKSTDKNLPEPIKQLMQRIRREGYSEELINDWLSQHNEKIENQRQKQEREIRKIKLQIILRVLGLVTLLFWIAIQVRSCLYLTQ